MRKLFFLLLALVATTSLWAQRFRVGDLYYNITSSSAPYTVEVSDAVSSITTATIPESITHNGATYSVTSIGERAFYDCSSLTSITIPNSVTSIEYRAFYGCSSLTSITIPNSVTSIGEQAFLYCSSLTSITIPNSVTSIGSSAFNGCSSLTSIIVEKGNSIYDSRENCNAIIETATNTLIAGCQNTTIPNSVTSIGDFAFSGCSSLTSITIPNSVTSIGEQAFLYCSSLTSITIPNSVTSIGSSAFNGCSSLTSIIVEKGNSIYDSRENCNAIIETATNTLIAGCQNTTIPNSVTSIGDFAFSGCSSLTSITIPNSVTSIGVCAFRNCSSLTSIICLGTTPPDAIHLDANTSTCKLIVPRSAYNAYLRHAYWGQFLNIVPSSEIESSAPEVYINPANPAQKLLRNGQVYILKDDKTYTIMGAQIQ